MSIEEKIFQIAKRWGLERPGPENDELFKAAIREALAEQSGTHASDLDAMRAELDKEQAHSKYLAEAMSRQIDERIAVENQCAYYRTQYTRAETIRKEACEANVKAQTRMLWLEDDNKALRARLEQAEEALTEIAEWTDRYTSPGHPIGTVARAAMQERQP